MKDFFDAMQAVGMTVMTMDEGDTEPRQIKAKQAPPSRVKRTHTPGPWFLDTCGDGSLLIQPREGFSICPVNPRAGFEHDIPNFQLMAAAPELLAACREAVAYLKETENAKNMKGPEYGIWHRLTAVIAKAEGGR